jgi:hypothetical protein
MEKYYEYDKDLFMVFEDFKQAYNSINRQQLWTALRNFEIPEKLVRMIQICNLNKHSKYVTKGNFHYNLKFSMD